MKIIATVLSVCLFWASNPIFAQHIEKTIVQSFDLQGLKAVILDIPNADVEVKTWSNSELSVQMTISVPSNLEEMQKSLIAAGRYTLKATPTANTMNLVGLNLKRNIIFRGAPWKDKVKCVVFAPQKAAVQVVDSSPTVEAAQQEVVKN